MNLETKKNHNQSKHKQNNVREDILDGLAIVGIILIVVSSIIYYLYNLPS